MTLYLLIGCFFLISLTYSSVGFAGGSSYVALMGVVAVNFHILKPAALLCNILVATGGTVIFYKEGWLDLRKYWPFLLVSIPMAFLGGYWPIRENAFFLILGATLVVASLFLWIQRGSGSAHGQDSPNAFLTSIGLGGGIGLLSGITSIGGGIFLSPLLHLLNWDQAKRISAFASLFILVNSISGLVGQLMQQSTIDWNFVWPLMVAVFLGGQIGSRLGATKFNALYIKRITAVLIFLAGMNILYHHL